MLEVYADNYGDKWLTSNVLYISAYGGGGSVAEANLRWLESKENCSYIFNIYYIGNNLIYYKITNNLSAIITNTHIGKKGFIRYTGKYADPELIKATKKLENYPCYDDMLVSEVEMEWENEAWNNWLKSDLIETLPEKLFKLVSSTVKDEQEEDNIYSQAYRQAMEDNNEYPIPQSDHVYINVERISPAFCEAVKKHF